ncbi:MAG: hypothetical protein ABEJ81_04980 [Haloferacaceae archaeon]
MDDGTRTGRSDCETLDAFEATLRARPAYVPPAYEVSDAPGAAAGGRSARRDVEGGPDALAGLLDVLAEEDDAVVVVAGEGGVGKSRLLAELGRAVEKGTVREGDRDENGPDGPAVRYVRPSRVERPPPIDGDTLLFLDDAGRLAHPERFLALPTGTDHTVQVVAAVRPIHRRALAAGALPDEIPRYDVSLEPLDADRTVDLLAEDCAPERARAVHEATGGNPALARRLAADGTATGGAPPEGEDGANEAVTDALDAAVEAACADCAADVETARALLRAVAVLGAHAPGAEGESGGLPVDDPADRRRILSELSDAGLLAAVERAGREGPAFVHRSSVVAEHCRSRALADGSTGDAALLDRRLGTDAVGIARGLVELRGSPLVRADVLDAATVAERTRSLLEEVAGGVLDADAPLADALRVGALVDLVAPDAVPHAELVAQCGAGDPTTAGSLYRLAARTYRHAAATATDEYDLSVPPSALFAHARTWLDRLNGLAIDRPDDATLQHRLAQALRSAAADERAAGNAEGARTCLDRLDVLADDTPGVDAVQVAFALALGDATGAAGEAGRVDDLDPHLDRLATLADEHADAGGVRRAVAVALVNATGHEGGAGRVEVLETRLDRVAALADGHPDDAVLQHRLAQALLNVTSAEADAGRFTELDPHLDRLDALAADHPGSAEIRHRFAQALLSAVDHEARAGRFDDLEPHLDRLDALAADHPGHDGIQRRLAQALLAVVDNEAEAGRDGELAARLDRLAALAHDHPDNGAVQVPATGGCLIALRRLAEAGQFEAVAGAVETLGTLARRPQGLVVGAKGTDVAELAAETGERLLRAGRIDLFETFADALADGLSGGRWRSVSSDLFMTADSLVGEGVLSMDAYTRVVECCGS